MDSERGEADSEGESAMSLIERESDEKQGEKERGREREREKEGGKREREEERKRSPGQTVAQLTRTHQRCIPTDSDASAMHPNRLGRISDASQLTRTHQRGPSRPMAAVLARDRMALPARRRLPVPGHPSGWARPLPAGRRNHSPHCASHPVNEPVAPSPPVAARPPAGPPPAAERGGWPISHTPSRYSRRSIYPARGPPGPQLELDAAAAAPDA